MSLRRFTVYILSCDTEKCRRRIRVPFYADEVRQAQKVRARAVAQGWELPYDGTHRCPQHVSPRR